MKIQDR